ncbi:MAG: NAD(P)/FAD-dependent oxidoreductase [Acidobacteriota bacterium]|nr:NAD(P)/FAD-dependent oxidoreductase [Acidobacteriota bacterium]
MNIPNSSQVCVIGGGPAGLSAAIALTQAGCEATVIDCATPPIDKACGEGLMPDSIAVLAELGVAVPPEIGFAFNGIRFYGERSSVVADFPSGSGVGLRHTALHSLLIRRAQELGITLAWGMKNIRLVETGVAVGQELLNARFIVAADGQNSSVRRQAGLNRTVHQTRRYGFRRHYRIAPWSSYMELHWGPQCQIYVTPVSHDEVCVALISRQPQLRLDTALAHFSEVRSRLKGAVAVSSEMGALSVSRILHRVCNRNVALVGDASGSVDAVTGEGLCLAFRQSLVLARALRAGELHAYQARHRRLSRRPQTMAALMLTLDKHPSFQRRALTSLVRRPGVFEKLLAVHVGERSFAHLLSWDLLPFCYAFLVA